MNYEEVKKLMLQLNTPHVKVIDTNGKKILDFIGEYSVDNTINKLESFLSSLQTYGRVTFLAATEACLKQNWKDCYQWPVTFNAISAHLTNNQQGDPKPAHGFISHNEASLMATVSALQMQMKFQEQINELNRKIEGKSKESESPIDKYLPMAGLFVDITDDKIANMMKLYQMQAMSKGVGMQQQTGMAGLNIANNPSVKMTEDEKKQALLIVDEMDKLGEKTSNEKILALVKALNENPAYIDMALTFMNQKK